LPLKTASINIANVAWLFLWELKDAAVHTLTPSNPQAFFENHIPGSIAIDGSSELRVT
jgi:hypothetical protein